MKKLRILCIIMVAFTGYIAISGYKTGPAFAEGYDCTGAETGLGNAAGCGFLIGCHSRTATAGISLTIELDSAGGVPTTNFFPGKVYTIKITGTNNTTNNLPRFGFQVSAIMGSTSQTTPTNAGSFPAPYPTNTHLEGPRTHDDVANIVEHSTPLSPTTGTGGNGSTYVETINWTAPTGWTGIISIWAALNAVNNNDTCDPGDLWNTNHIVITQGPAGIDEITDNKDVKVYPNPCNGMFTISIKNYELGIRKQVEVYNLMGEEVYSQSNISQGDPFGQNSTFNIDLGHQPAGIYLYKVTSENSSALSGKIIVQ